MLRDVTKRPYLTPRGSERAGFAHADTHMQTCAHGANMCIQLPVAACIKFQILVLAHKTMRGSPVPSLQATIQQNMPASVLCPGTADPFALLSLCWEGQHSTQAQLFSSLALKWRNDLDNSKKQPVSIFPQQGENCLQEYLASPMSN